MKDTTADWTVKEMEARVVEWWHREPIKRDVRIFDNGGQTFDRYTVIIGHDVYAMNDDPLSPQGVNMYCGEIENLPGAREGEDIGDVPARVIEAICKRIKETHGGISDAIAPIGRIVGKLLDGKHANRSTWSAKRR